MLFVACVGYGCMVDQGDGTFEVNAQITQVGNTIMSVKYKIGETWVFDDIIMKNNMGLFGEIKKSHKHTVPLKIHIEFKVTDEPKEESALKYYYGANLLGQSQSFDTDAILLIAKQNESLFNWTVRDGKSVSEKRDETKVDLIQKNANPVKPKESEKL